MRKKTIALLPKKTMFTNNDIDNIKHWMETAGKLAIAHQSQPRIHLKPDCTPVTDVEQRVEEMLIKRIQRNYPGHQILTEENGLIGSKSEYLWTIDPIDGTKPYLRCVPVWGISLGLLHNEEPLAGFILFPALHDFYWSGIEGAFWNDRKLQLSPTQPFQDELVFLAVSSNCHRYYEICYPRLQAFGSTIFHLICLVRGLAIGVLIRRVNLWDFASILPMFRHLGIAMEYVSRRGCDLSNLVKGQKTAEELIATPARYLSQLHDCVVPKTDVKRCI